MEVFNSMDMLLLVGLTLMIGIFSIFYVLASKKQSRAMVKVDMSLKLLEQMNHQLHSILGEQRRLTRILAEVVGIEIPEPIEASAAGANDQSGTDDLSSQNKLYVGNIDYSATESELASHFARYGRVEFVNIPVNRYTGRARGFGFVTFGTQDDAERAMALNGSEFKGRQIQVNFAKERDGV
jgi:cold-inducible RNA-binding protein